MALTRPNLSQFLEFGLTIDYIDTYIDSQWPYLYKTPINKLPTSPQHDISQSFRLELTNKSKFELRFNDISLPILEEVK